MELKDIKIICKEEIVDLINKSNKGLIYRKYETFLDLFGMSGKRNFDILKKVDYQLKKNGISFWAGNEQVISVSDFKRGETITFRCIEAPVKNDRNENAGLQKIGYKNAGTIEVSNEERCIDLFTHQQDAIQNLNDKILKANRTPFAGLIVLPTGAGKTLTAAYWLSKNFLDKGKKILWVAHRHELLDQAKTTFHGLAFKDIFSAKRSFNYRIISGIHDKPVNIRASDDIIISSKDSLNAGFDYLNDNWIKNNDDIFLVIDEAHHATAKTYRKLIQNLSKKTGQFRMLGLTATPFRTADFEQGLLAKVFPDDIVYKIDLRTLISRGILSEPIFEEVNTGYDITKSLSDKEIENLQYFDIDSIGTASAKTIAENDERNWMIVNKYVKQKDKYKQTIVFALNQDNAIALKKLFANEGVKVDFVLSSIKNQATGATLSSKENKDKIDRFRNGELEVLINVNILTEGTDVPKVQSIFLARPTKSSILMTQMIGRGLRGEKAGGTKESFIVSFIDNWQDKVSWVNPEKLLIEENIDFRDKDGETRKQIIRLVSIEKVEEFAILTNKIIDASKRELIENLDFIERLPLGIFHFSVLIKANNSDEIAKNCEILVYSNIKHAYDDFVHSLPDLFRNSHYLSKDYLTEEESLSLSNKVENDFFYGCAKYPGYRKEDIEDILQYYCQNETLPEYVELKEREKYNITSVASEILDKNLTYKEGEEFKNQLWESKQTEWKAFFGFGNKRYFLNEVDLAIRKLTYPDLFKKTDVTPRDIKELRKLEEMSMAEIKEYNPEYWKWLSDKVFDRYKDGDGNYVCAISDFKSTNKLAFQIDHIEPISKGGLTTLENLQLLTRKENALKGAAI